jgi:hypothetical protein
MEANPTTIVQYLQEAKKLRHELEQLSDANAFNPANKEQAMKLTRLDELERYIYLARQGGAV